MLAGSNNDFIDGPGGDTLTNKETITGFGTIGNGHIFVTNNATIDANVSGTTLTVNPNGSAASTNTKTMEATNGGTLQLLGASWTNTGGTISAGTGSSVVLNGTTITGGTLTTAGTGTMTSVNSTLNGLTNSGNLIIANNTNTNSSRRATQSANAAIRRMTNSWKLP